MTRAEPPRAVPFADEAIGLKAWEQMVFASTGLLRELDEELRREHDVALGDYDVLVGLSHAPGGRMRMCDLANTVLLSPSGLTRRVERLEREGLVARKRSDGDARTIDASLTSAGKRLLRRLRATHHGGIRERFADRFSEDELATLAALLGRLRSATSSGNQRD